MVRAELQVVGGSRVHPRLRSIGEPELPPRRRLSVGSLLSRYEELEKWCIPR